MAAFLAKIVIPRSRSWSMRVHHPVGDFLVSGERARLAQQGVDEGRLAMIDVGDDGDVAQVFTGRHSVSVEQRRPLAGAYVASIANHADPVQVEEIVWVTGVDG